MAYNQFEDFTRCLNCGHPYFKQENLVVLKPEPVHLHDDDYNYVEPNIKQTKYIYICAKCGTVLDRAKAAQVAEDKRVGRTAMFYNTPQPDPNSSGSDPNAGKPTITS